MGDSVGEKTKASGKTVLTGEKEESRVGGADGGGTHRPSLKVAGGGGMDSG